ncbi:MAG: ribosome assembly cofactor RimP [Marinilabiliaceae bacterium]
MITKEDVLAIVRQKVEDDGNFIVEVEVSPSNEIRIVVDSENGIPISYCEEIDALVETSLDREKEDYSLEVSSAGICAEFKVFGQFRKNIGNKVEVTMPNGAWVRGVLVDADEAGFDIETEEKKKVEGEKKKQVVKAVTHYDLAAVKSVRDIIEF